ncbi:type II secretion system F family protein [Paenibacillus sp. JX-17]|uniref:Type II secretion system F family protein n=1 Tax=Paenibacillus lacisoli TaxID=3064525 RepID=A0ABT9CDE6_9BACL|nr:type II secretion system F family protein [Paenibacillus sp. JX-17]MDO7907295.1 type II secretion system F family protein [Paenibacillus sp. JX-17]
MGIVTAVAGFLALTAGWLGLYLIKGEPYRYMAGLDMPGIKLKKWSPPFLFLLHAGRIGSRLPIVVFRIQRAVQKIYGVRQASEKTMLFLAEMMGFSWLMLLGGCVLSLISGGSGAGLIIGCLLAAVLPFAILKDLYSKVSRREEAMLLELPELLNKMTLLVGAGETVQRAIIHCVERKKEEECHPLYRELRQTLTEWESGYSFQQAFENLSKRCGVQEISVFTTTILLNMRRGGTDFVMSLRDLSQILWSKRTAITRTRGEQASSKLVFPMAVLFMVVLVLVGAPAFMMMNF